MKYLFLIPPFLLVYVIRDIPTLIKEQDLMRGIAAIVLISLLGIFFTAWLNEVKKNFKIEKRIENNSYDWSLFE